MSTATIERPRKAAAANGKSAEITSFYEGRDLAIEMLRAGDALELSGQAEPRRWVRDGSAQNRFVLSFLQRLRADPELMDGFAAVLSARLGTSDHRRSEFFALDWAEYQPGRVGAEGTSAGPEADQIDQKPQNSPAAAQPALPSAPRAEDFDVDGASRRLAHARSVSWMLCQIFGNATGASPSEIRELEGLMGTVQHLRNVLAKLHEEVNAVIGALPYDFLTGVFEASSLATLVDEVEWLASYTFAMGNETLSEYFSAICAACDQATTAINAFEGAPA